jgi:hypothetical protein
MWVMPFHHPMRAVTPKAVFAVEKIAEPVEQRG